MSIITKFNINARYDDYKKEFQNKCTDEYTIEQIQNIEEVRTWLKNLLHSLRHYYLSNNSLNLYYSYL